MACSVEFREMYSEYALFASAYGSWPTWWGAFDPYGAEIDTNVTTNNYKFSGTERDVQTGESGLDNFGARSYSSNLVGKFMQTDPAGLASVNLWNSLSFYRYGYAMNNPLSLIDPTGLDCVYLNSDGTGTDPDNDGIDHSSDSQECSDSGGYWAEGYVASAANVQTYSNSDLISVNSVLNGQSVSNLSNCLTCSTQNPDGSLLGSSTQILFPSDFTISSQFASISPPLKAASASGQSIIGPTIRPSPMSASDVRKMCTIAGMLQGGGTVPGSEAPSGPSIETPSTYMPIPWDSGRRLSYISINERSPGVENPLSLLSAAGTAGACVSAVSGAQP